MNVSGSDSDTDCIGCVVASPRLKRMRPAGAAVLGSETGGLPDPDAVTEEYVREEAEAGGKGVQRFRRDGFVLP